ncbi:MAG: hypothetical protein NT133_08825 [Alphaproteobacteria bacterium]|nr:hypothetical protein [Alphaproteobacteria bacterium]
MSYAVQHEVWQIDPVTQRVTADEALGNPVLIVIETGFTLSATIMEVCDFLQITVHSTQDPRDIPALLAEASPLAVIHEAADVNFTVYDMLMVVASHDTGLPVMVVLPESPQNRSALEAARQLWQIDELTHATTRPGIRTLIDFLFNAGRRLGRGRFMPV